MQTMINTLKNARNKINDVSGNIVMIEVKLKLLAEKNKKFRDEIHKLATRTRYWNTDIKINLTAFSTVFNDSLSSKAQSFKGVRDEMLHGNPLCFISSLGLVPDGQEISASGKRNTLVWPENPEDAAKQELFKQSIVRFDTNGIPQEFRALCVTLEEKIDNCLIKENISMQTIINTLNSTRNNINEVSGNIVMIEMKLKLLAEKNKKFRDEVHKLAAKTKYKNYWNADLEILLTALSTIFSDSLSAKHQNALTFFKRVRNGMLHGNLIDFISSLGLVTEGQEISASGKRNTLIWPKNPEDAAKQELFKQSIVRFHNNGIPQEFRVLQANLEEAIENCLRGE